MSMEKILRLTLKKKWFDMIASGEKKEEYREIKIYWTNRLVNKPFSQMSKSDINLLKQDLYACPTEFWRKYDSVMFTNGYSSDSPQMKVELLGVELGYSKGKWCDGIEEYFYVIKLGKIIWDNSLR